MQHRPSSFTPSLLSLLFAAASSLLAPPAAAQQEKPGVFAEIIDVRVVNLEVVVTDRDGVRVSGLSPEDFELVVDGETLPIEYFTEVLGGKAVKAADGSAAGLPSLQPGEAVGTSYLLFIDEYFGIEKDRDRVLESVVEDLPLLGEEDRLAVVAFDGRRLEMLSSWSQSPATIERVLKEATRRPAQGLRRVIEERTMRRSLADDAALGIDRSDPVTGPGIEQERYAQELAAQVERVVAAASATLRSFASPPGRKVMLLVSGGWPFTPLEYTVGLRDQLFFDRGIPAGPELFRPLTHTANRLGYTLYPVDAPGLEGDGGGLAFDRLGAAGDQGGLGFEREQLRHASLGFLADETGGRALLNAGRFDSLPRVAEDTRSYYWLGFTPPWQGDEQVHDVRVRVKRQGLEVRSRASFQDLSRSSQITNMVESAMLFGNSPSTRPLALEFGRARRAGFGKVQVPLKITFPAQEIVLLPGAEGYSGRLELRVAAINENGDRSDIPVTELAVERQEPPPEGLLLSFSTELKMRRAPHDVVVSIYDPLSGALLSARKPISP